MDHGCVLASGNARSEFLSNPVGRSVGTRPLPSNASGSHNIFTLILSNKLITISSRAFLKSRGTYRSSRRLGVLLGLSGWIRITLDTYDLGALIFRGKLTEERGRGSLGSWLRRRS